MKEEWKVYKIWNRVYKFSNLGNGINWEGNQIKGWIDARGYRRFSFSIKGGKQLMFMWHRIIAELFVPNPDMKPFVNHKNGNKSDNSASNLEWVTNRENVVHSFKHLGRKGSMFGRSGAKHNRSKGIKCLETTKTYGSIAEASRETGIPVSSISHAVVGNRPSAKGFRFEYT